MTALGRRGSTLTRTWLATGSAGALVGCLWLALQHPLYPGFALATCATWFVVLALRPGMWLFVLPAALPIASLAPWTGWLTFDEFDLLAAGAVAGGFVRMAIEPMAVKEPDSPRLAAAVIVFGGLGLLGLIRGMCDAGAMPVNLFEGYTSAANSFRILKPLLYALLFLPLLQRDFRDAASSAEAIDRLTGGMLLGLCFVLLAALQERAAYPGLLDFSGSYRTVALFWEMHVGGAAIDAYLALTAPFVAWALWTARSGPGWGFAAFLALVTEYGCLTTFSRGVYLAVFGPLVALGAHLARRRRVDTADRPAFRAHRACSAALLVAVALQALLVLGSDSFMLSRIGSSERDMHSRIAHWQQGLTLLKTPTDWLLGVGLGRFPARYAATARGGEFPGAVTLDAIQAGPVVRLSGPRSLPALGGNYALTQRVPIETGPAPTASLHVRASQTVRLRVSLCEMHLLYERRCQDAHVRIEPTAGAWHTASVVLEGPQLSAGAWYARRSGVFSVSVLDADASVELNHLSLKHADEAERLYNGHFTHALAGWFPVAKNQFPPWHIDNLYLELLIERGVCGLALFLLLVVFVIWRLGFGAARSCAISPFLLASLAGAMTIGLVSSIMDVPRVAFGLFLVVLASALLKPE